MTVKGTTVRPRRVRHVPAPVLAERAGFTLQKPMHEHQKIHYGNKALPGQYVRSYTRHGYLPDGAVVENGVVVKHPAVGRVSKGALKRYLRDHGSEGKLDFAESINARR